MPDDIRIPSTTPPPQQPPPVADEAPPQPNASVESIPPNIDDITQMLKIRGEVFQSRADGMVRIMTDQGEIVVKLDPREAPPAGTKVQVEVYPGNPPTAARVTPEKIQGQPLRLSETPVEVVVRPPSTAPTPERPATDIPVRLEPITPEQALAYVTEPLETITASIQAATEATTRLIAQIAEDETTAQLSQALTARADRTDFSARVSTTLTDAVYQPAATADVSALTLSDAILFTPPDLTETSTTTTVLDNLTKIQTSFDGMLKPEAMSSFAKLPAAFAARIAKVQEQIVQLVGGGGEKNSTPNNMLLNNQQAGTLTATVIAQTPQKLPVVAFFGNPAAPSFSNANFFVLHAPSDSFAPGGFIPGAEITFLPQEDGLLTLSVKPSTAASIISPLAIPASLTPFSPEPWPLMNEILDVLNSISPQTAQAFSNMVPSPGRPMIIPPAAMFFIAALRGGELSNWLGEPASDSLKRAGRESLISRLMGDGAAMNRAETITPDWKGMSIPLMWDNQIHKLALYYKHDSNSGKESPEGGKMVRFVFDLALDNMGKVQLDGLFRANKLDLIVRSEASFSQAMQMQMRQAYIAALEPTEVRGELSFQNKPEQWVTINPERQKFGTSA